MSLRSAARSNAGHRALRCVGCIPVSLEVPQVEPNDIRLAAAEATITPGAIPVRGAEPCRTGTSAVEPFPTCYCGISGPSRCIREAPIPVLRLLVARFFARSSVMPASQEQAQKQE
jgi:hypothetical protein